MERLPIQTSNTLKQKATSRILLDMIQDTKAKAGNTFLIIIVDDYTVKILSSFLTMSEVLNQGVFSIEKLDLNRQKFPRYHGLYFISPTSESCQKVLDDFKTDNEPTYSRVHLFFPHRIQDLTLESLVTPTLAKRIKSCKELNLSFLSHTRNVFDLDLPRALSLFRIAGRNELRDQELSSISERLFTVCSNLKEFPYIQFQNTSSMSKRLANFLQSQLSNFYASNSDYNKKRGTLLIVDRSFDIATPLLHDYTYNTMVYDLFQINHDSLTVNGKSYNLNDKDSYWMKYKNKHIFSVFEEIQNDVEEFSKNDIKAKANQGDLQSFDDMSKIVRSIKGYTEKQNLMNLHIQLAQDITKIYKDHSLYEVIELEQDIVTGVNANGGNVTTKDIKVKFNKLKNLLDEDEALRLLALMHCCLDINERDFNTLAEGLPDSKLKAIINLKYLGITFSEDKKSGRRESKLTKNEIKEFKEKNKALQYNTLRSSPKIEGLAEACSSYELNRTEFPFVEEPKTTAVKKRYGISTGAFGGADEDEENPNLIVFVIGGMGTNEVSALERLSTEKKINHNIVVGSTNILTAKDYLKKLGNLGEEGVSSTIGNVIGINEIELAEIK